MAVTLQFLSRAASKSQALAASPKVLGAITPRTPALSPGVAAQTAQRSPFFGELSSSPSPKTALSFGTPSSSPTKTLPFEAWQQPTGSPARFLIQASATATTHELSAAARPSAEAALEHFMARRSKTRPSGPTPSPQLGESGFGLGSVLLGRRSSEVPGAAEFEDAPASLEAFSAGARKVSFDFDPRQAAREAREAFMAKQQRVQSRDDEAPGNAQAMPTLLRRGPLLREQPPAAAAKKLDFDRGEAARAARDVFLAKQQRVESRNSPMVP